MIGILIFILTIFFIGYFISTLFSIKKEDIFYQIGLSWGLGIAGISFQMITYSLLGLHWTIFSLFIPWIIIFLTTFFLVKKKLPNTKRLSFSVTPYATFFLILILISFLIVLFESVLHPVISWDAIASWFLGGKAFYIDGFINPSFIRFANNSTPPVLNLLVTFSYIVMGGINDTLALLIYPIFYLCMLLIFYSLVRIFLPTLASLFSLSLLALTPNIMRHAGRYDAGYADLPLAYFFLLEIYVLFLFIQTRSTRLLVLLNISLGTGALLRSEGIPFFIIIQIVVLFFIAKWKKHKKIFVAFIGLLHILAWQIFKIYYSLPANPFITGTPKVDRLPSILLEAGREFTNIGRWNFLWIAFLISMVIFFLKKRRDRWEIILFFTCVGQMTVYLLVYLTTPREPIEHMRNSFDRLLLHIAPIAMVFIAYINISFFRQLFKSKS